MLDGLGKVRLLGIRFQLRPDFFAGNLSSLYSTLTYILSIQHLFQHLTTFSVKFGEI